MASVSVPTIIRIRGGIKLLPPNQVRSFITDWGFAAGVDATVGILEWKTT
jgi:hypothetical protein